MRLGLALVFLLLCLAGALFLWHNHETALQAGQRAAEERADILARHLADRVDTIEAALAELAAHDRMIGGPNAAYDQWLPVLGVAKAALEGVESVAVIDAAGLTTYSSRTEAIGQSWAKKPIYIALSADAMSDALAADTPSRSPIDGEMTLPLGRALRTVDGAFEGMLVASLVPAHFEGLYDSVDFGPKGSISVFAPTGEILARTPPAQMRPDRSIASSSDQDVTARRSEKKSGVTITVSLAKNDLLRQSRSETISFVTGLTLLGIVFLAIAWRLRAGWGLPPSGRQPVPPQR